MDLKSLITKYRQEFVKYIYFETSTVITRSYWVKTKYVKDLNTVIKLILLYGAQNYTLSTHIKKKVTTLRIKS